MATLSNQPTQLDVQIARNTTWNPTCVLTFSTPDAPLIRLPLNLTDVVITLMVKPTNTAAASGDPDSNAILVLDNADIGGIVVADDPTTGICYPTITPEMLTDLEVFPEGVALYYALRVVDVSSQRFEPIEGNFTVNTYVYFDA